MTTHASHDMKRTECIRCGFGDWDQPEKLSEPCPFTPDQELAYLRYYHGEAQDAFGPADSDVDHYIAEGYDGVVPRGWDPRRHNEDEEDEGEDEEA